MKKPKLTTARLGQIEKQWETHCAPFVESSADVYLELIEEGWGEYFRRRSRRGLLTYDVAQIMECLDRSLEGVKAHKPYMPRVGGKCLLRLVLKHHHNKQRLLSIAAAFLIEVGRRQRLADAHTKAGRS